MRICIVKRCAFLINLAYFVDCEIYESDPFIIFVMLFFGYFVWWNLDPKVDIFALWI